MTKIVCPKCKREIEFSENQLGEVATCDSCKTSFIADRQPRISISPAQSLSDGTFCEVEVDGEFYSLKMLRRLRIRYCVYTTLFLFQFACLVSCAISCMHGMRSFSHYAFSLLAVIFIPFFISYVRFLKSIRKSDFGFLLYLLLFILIPVLIFRNYCALFNNLPFFTTALLVLLDLIFCRIIYALKAAAVLKSAMISPAEGKKCSGVLKWYSLFLLPLLISLFISVFFLGSVRNEDIGLCKDCGGWSGTKSICFLGIRLISFPEYKPTAFSLFLDPERKCSHGGERVYYTDKNEFLYPPAEDDWLLRHLFSRKRDHDKRGPLVSRYSQGKWYMVFMRSYDNMREDSPLYRYLRERNSQSFAHRMISDELNNEDIESLCKAIDPEAIDAFHRWKSSIIEEDYGVNGLKLDDLCFFEE